MSTANFRTQKNFPLYCYDDSELDYWESQWLYQDVKNDLDSANDDFAFFKIKIESGYYCGLQFYVTLTDCADNAGFTEDGAEYADNESCRYWFDMYLSQAKRKFEAETRKVNKILSRLASDWDFEEYYCVGRFSNGEAIYTKASAPRAGLYQAANA